MKRGLGPVLLCCAAIVPGWAADVTRPADVAGLSASRSVNDVHLTWSTVGADVLGAPETIGSYKIYRGTSAAFVPDRSGGSNLAGSSALPQFTDSGAAVGGPSYFYLVSAVDAAGNESGTRPSSLVPPVLSGSWTDTTIELQWTPAQPAGGVSGYRVYCGRAPQTYESVVDVGLATSRSLSGLQAYVNWYCAVTAVDSAGNESAFSNEHVEAVAGRVRVRAHDADYLCWISGGASCPPGPGRIQRNDGFQLLVPVAFPEGDWKRVLVSYTLDSRLCGPPVAPNKCGDTNPGGWNPCGDPWDRIAQLFLVLDDCVAAGTSCITPNNLELMRAITPFGTDAAPPDGSGVVPPRKLTLDVTPFAPLLTGTRYVGAEIAHFTQAGWHVTVEFEFSERADEASLKPPAAGIQVVGFGNAPLPARAVTIPATATHVVARVFTTGHGGTNFCDGGSNNGGACSNDTQCPGGGSCLPCDEFCHRRNRILKNGSPVFQFIPFRTDCSPAGNPCSNWNACGFPSCTFPRAGWCPGYIACHQNAPCDQDLDFTAALPPGGTYNLAYDVLVQRGSWPVSLVVYWYDN
ncbi:MAG TPA: peptide-N-glycosidase F-related protein [Candidatus Polarisedimenticolaceae bacterium]|nr:peptide-N-glycosidase F-related protein [Candidatus Polarisedimenticolaceae bacterium]